VANVSEEYQEKHNQEYKKAPVLEEINAQAKTIIWLLAASVGLLMIGYGLVMPIFAKRLSDMGAGVDALGYMTMAFAVGQFLFAPILGAVADKRGRRPLILVALGVIIVANAAYLVASEPWMYIFIRFWQGALTAGLLPASIGVVSDLMPANSRAKWIGILMSSYMGGFIFGPFVGGVLYDTWGFGAPFVVSAVFGAIGLIFGLLKLPETRWLNLYADPEKTATNEVTTAKKAVLPRPFYLFATLLALDFLVMFVFAFIEPQMAFYFYEQLKFSTTQFGLLVGVYALAMVIGQATLGKLSDRFGRKPIILVGLLMNMSFYIGLAVARDYSVHLVVAAIAGIGASLIMPALSAFYIDISSEEHRSRIMGIKESAAALGGAAGPLLVAIVSQFVTPQIVFLISAGMTFGGFLLALAVLRRPRSLPEPELVGFPTPNPDPEPERELVAR
jgi:MFS family permease